MTILAAPDGRALDVSVSGPADGMPLLWHHGTPASVFADRAEARAIHDCGLRLVTWSRPGYGSSSPRPGRRVIDVVDDVVTILDHLDAARCVTAGRSGGGPHALASGAGAPDRVAGVLVLAGVAPFALADGPVPGLDFLDGMGEDNVEEFTLATRGEAALRPWLETTAAGMRDVDAAGLVTQLRSLLPPVDSAMVTDEYGEDLLEGFREALRTGVEGWLEDDLAFVAPWGFDLAAMRVPVFLWQGDADLMVPAAHGRWLAEHAAGAVAHLVPGAGHFSVAHDELDAAVREVLAAI